VEGFSVRFSAIARPLMARADGFPSAGFGGHFADNPYYPSLFTGQLVDRGRDDLSPFVRTDTLR